MSEIVDTSSKLDIEESIYTKDRTVDYKKNPANKKTKEPGKPGLLFLVNPRLQLSSNSLMTLRSQTCFEKGRFSEGGVEAVLRGEGDNEHKSNEEGKDRYAPTTKMFIDTAENSNDDSRDNIHIGGNVKIERMVMMWRYCRLGVAVLEVLNGMEQQCGNFLMGLVSDSLRRLFYKNNDGGRKMAEIDDVEHHHRVMEKDILEHLKIDFLE
ncbi:hypothetical protein Tco_0880806, partial [Tanacetum coccineum]